MGDVGRWLGENLHPAVTLSSASKRACSKTDKDLEYTFEHTNPQKA